MPVAPIPVVTDFSYTELKERVEVLSRRVNSLTAMEVSLIDIDQTPSINITEDNSLLKLPDLSQIDCEQLAEDLIACEIACDEALAIANSKIDCLEDIVTPGELNGAGAWNHAVGTTVSANPPFSEACGYTATSSISIKFIEMDGANPKLQFYRVNNDSDCQANGSINWPISINYDGSSPLSIPWSGAKGATSALERTISPGTYYVYAYGQNLFDNAGQQELQAKGSFTLSGTGEIVRTITTSVTTTEGDAAPCA